MLLTYLVLGALHCLITQAEFVYWGFKNDSGFSDGLITHSENPNLLVCV